LKALLIGATKVADVTPIKAVSKGKGTTSAISPMAAGNDCGRKIPIK